MFAATGQPGGCVHTEAFLMRLLASCPVSLCLSQSDTVCSCLFSLTWKCVCVCVCARSCERAHTFYPSLIRAAKSVSTSLEHLDKIPLSASYKGERLMKPGRLAAGRERGFLQEAWGLESPGQERDPSDSRSSPQTACIQCGCSQDYPK